MDLLRLVWEGNRKMNDIEIKLICVYPNCHKWFETSEEALSHFSETNHSIHELEVYGFDNNEFKKEIEK